jgi:hypothetical protein
VNSTIRATTIESAAHHARPSTEAERQSMLAVVAKLDQASRDQDVATLVETFHPSAVCEFKPAGVRIASRATIAEMFRRTLPKLSSSYFARRQLRQWSNQDGLLREWSYPVELSSGQEVFTTQLEIVEFIEGLECIRSYRIRMNSLFSKFFVWALGDDFASLDGVEEIPC